MSISSFCEMLPRHTLMTWALFFVNILLQIQGYLQNSPRLLYGDQEIHKGRSRQTQEETIAIVQVSNQSREVKVEATHLGYW